ncbi:MAG: hypothetical protein ACXAC5_04780 [Promethearchaeota archaeon]|jgi:hypothetical protein
MGKYSKGNPKDNKFQVTITFPTEELMENFCGYMSDGGGEWGFMEGDGPCQSTTFDYSRCFPAWGWKKGQPKFIDVFVINEKKN